MLGYLYPYLPPCGVATCHHAELSLCSDNTVVQQTPTMFYYVPSWLLCPLKSAVDSIHPLIVWSRLYRTKLVVCLVGISVRGREFFVFETFNLTGVLI